MEKSVLLVLVSDRKACADRVQQILTDWGCLIKTRLGLHTGTLDDCSESGLIFIELVGERDKHTELARKLNLIKGVKAELVTLVVDA